MKNTFYLLCLFVSSLFYSSCNNYLYTAPEANLLMLSEEGDMKVSAGLGFTTVREANVNVQAAYSPIEHLGVAMSYFQIGGLSHPKTDGENGNNGISSVTGELAVGYYLKKEINTVKNRGTEMESPVRNQLLFDAYAGYGFGNVRRAFNVGDLNFNSQHYFIQGGAHYQSKLLTISYALRGVLLDYTKGRVNGNLSDSDLARANSLKNSPFTFIESSFRVQAGCEKIKCYFSRSWMMAPLNNKKLDYGPTSWHAGIVLNLNALSRNKEVVEDI
ncbi:MAG: hypothetical protein ACJATF_000087 [Flavobacteriales bacterium]|jgi:hypothetical protein